MVNFNGQRVVFFYFENILHLFLHFKDTSILHSTYKSVMPNAGVSGAYFLPIDWQQNCFLSVFI